MSEIENTRRIDMKEGHVMRLFQYWDDFGIRRSNIVDLEVKQKDGMTMIYPMLLPIKVCNRPADEMNFDDPDISEYTEEEVRATYEEFMERYGDTLKD